MAEFATSVKRVEDALFWEIMLPAYAAFDDGDFTGATLDAAIAVEMLIDATLALAPWDSGVPADTAYNRKDHGSIVGRVRTRVASALGDDPSLWDSAAIPAGRWKRELTDLRNHVLYNGYSAGRDDACAASRLPRTRSPRLRAWSSKPPIADRAPPS